MTSTMMNTETIASPALCCLLRMFFHFIILLDFGVFRSFS
jgi:hypothetical protein